MCFVRLVSVRRPVNTPDRAERVTDLTECRPRAQRFAQRVDKVPGAFRGGLEIRYPAGEFRTGQSDVHLGDLDIPGIETPIGVWMSASQFAYWSHTHLTIDIVPGRGSGFSLEAPEGVRFLIRSRLFTEEELAAAGG